VSGEGSHADLRVDLKGKNAGASEVEWRCYETASLILRNSLGFGRLNNGASGLRIPMMQGTAGVEVSTKLAYSYET
jgi:hypothetical protein